MFTFIGDWLDSTDGPALNASLQRFVHAEYGLTDLQPDLARSPSCSATRATACSATRREPPVRGSEVTKRRHSSTCVGL